MMWNNSWGVGGWILMTLMMISFWALVVGVVIWLLRHSARQQPPALGEPVAQLILDQRFARGELTEAEYRQRRDLLRTR